MGYTVDLEEADLKCLDEEHAKQAAEIINGNDDMSYHLQVEVGDEGEARVYVTHFQGDHWNDDFAQELWKALAPHMHPGASIEFHGEDGCRWRIRWDNSSVYEDPFNCSLWYRGAPMIPEVPAGPAPAPPEKSAAYRVNLSVVVDMDETGGLPTREAIFENVAAAMQEDRLRNWVDGVYRHSNRSGLWSAYSGSEYEGEPEEEA